MPLERTVPATTPQVPVRELAATGMGEATGAAVGLVVFLVLTGTVLVLARRKENQG